QRSAGQVEHRETGKRVKAKQNHGNEQNQRAHTDSYGAIEEEGANGVTPEKSEENHRDIEKIAMQILQDEGKCRLAAIRSAALADHTGRGVEKERAIIGLPVVVAGHAESQRAAQNQQRGRKQPPMVMGVDQRRIKRGEVWPPFV